MASVAQRAHVGDHECETDVEPFTQQRRAVHQRRLLLIGIPLIVAEHTNRETARSASVADGSASSDASIAPLLTQRPARKTEIDVLHVLVFQAHGRERASAGASIELLLPGAPAPRSLARRRCRRVRVRGPRDRCLGRRRRRNGLCAVEEESALGYRRSRLHVNRVCLRSHAAARLWRCKTCCRARENDRTSRRVRTRYAGCQRRQYVGAADDFRICHALHDRRDQVADRWRCRGAMNVARLDLRAWSRRYAGRQDLGLHGVTGRKQHGDRECDR